MVLSYKFDNFNSFNGIGEFSMLITVGKVKRRYPNNYITAPLGFDVLKTAIIVGENAGGKSNFIGSLKFLRSLFESNSLVKSVHSYVNTQSLIKSENPVQNFELSFLYGDNCIYTYTLSLDKMGIRDEKLEKAFKRKEVPKVIFYIRRTGDGVYEYAGGKAENECLSILKNGNNSYGLFVSKLALLGCEDAMHTAEWFLDKLSPGSMLTDIDVKQRDDDIKILKSKRFLDIFRMVDYSICGLEIDEDKPYSKSLVIREDASGQRYKRELLEDSTGVREFFAWAVQIYRTIEEDRVVFADEMDRVLNPVLSDRVIAYINGSEHRGQFIFSTHNALHLDLKRYMKEQIYFVTKDVHKLTSEIYSLADFPEVRYETTKIYELYMKGVFGGTSYE